MSRTKEIRHISWKKTSSCKCRLDASVCNNKQHWSNDKCICECKELIGKGGYDDGFTWNHNACECESNKSCDFGEYLDYENCKCGKKLIGKLVLECKNEILNAIPLNETDAISVTDKNVICKLNICKLNKRHNCLIYIIL